MGVTKEELEAIAREALDHLSDGEHEVRKAYVFNEADIRSVGVDGYVNMVGLVEFILKRAGVTG